jgi:hypothetical protein
MTEITFKKYTEVQNYPLECSGDNKNNTYEGVKCVVLSSDRDRKYNKDLFFGRGAVEICLQRNSSCET